MTSLDSDKGRVSDFGIALQFARRELRGGLKGFRVFIACLALGVGAIAAVGSLSQMLQVGLASQALNVLGGDIDITLTQRNLTEQEQSWLRSQGEVSYVREMRAMGRGLRSDNRALIELKAADDLYPLYGELEFEQETTLAKSLEKVNGVWGAAVESKVLPRLGVAPGDMVRLGDIDVEIRDIVTVEPDRVSAGFMFAPRIFIAPEALDQTGLITFGSQIMHKYRLKLPAGTDSAAWIALAKENIEGDAANRIRGPEQGTQGAENFIERVSLFLTLVGLTTLIIGGVGVGNAIKAYLDGKTESIAIYKCLGATSTMVFQSFFIQVMTIACIGLFLGVLFGIIAPILVVIFFGDLLPIPAEISVYPIPLILAAIDGALVTMVFAIWPLAKARDVTPGALFRDRLTPDNTWPRLPYILAIAGALTLLGFLAVFITPYRIFALIFIAGAFAAFILLRLEAVMLISFVKALGRPRNPGLRMALTNLYRPGASTGSVVLSIGLGLTLLVAVALIEGNISRQINDELPDSVPSFFMLDIRRDQAEDFDALVDSLPGTQGLERQPIVRATVVSINNNDPDKDSVAPESRWFLERERNITYRAEQPENATLVAGEWWPADYDGPPLISLSKDVARGLNLTVGAKMTFSIVGREVTAEVANIRDIDVTRGATFFNVIFAPGPLDRAPQQNMALVHVDPVQEEAVYKKVTETFPNVTVVWVKEMTEALTVLLGQIAIAVQATGGVTIVAGVLVLAGAMASGHRHRVYDAVVMKVLGATKRRVLTAYIMEYAILGFSTAVVAAIVGTFGAYMIVTSGMEADWSFMPLRLFTTISVATVLTIMLGLLGTWRALNQKAAPILRAE